MVEVIFLAYIDRENKQVEIRIVYYGPGRSGKTTSLKSIFDKYQNRTRTQLSVIDTYDDKILFFDFLPLDIGKINGYTTLIRLYTVPGQVKYNATRRLVLGGVDGIIFVADSMAVRKEKNIISLQSLRENLIAQGKDIHSVPLVFQYNKRDLAEQGIPLLSVETLEKDLNSRLKAPFFEASATKGINVIPSLKKIISLTMATLKKQKHRKMAEIDGKNPGRGN